MSAVALVSFRTSALAWADAAEDQRLFRRVTSAVLAITAVLCLMLLLSPAPKPDRSQAQALPAPMAKMLLEHVQPLEPIAPKVQPEPKADATPEATPAKDSKPVPVKADLRPKNARANDEPKPVAVLDAREPVDNKPVVSEVDTARRRVASLGLLAAKDDIAQVRGGNVAVQIKTDIRQGSGVGGGTASGVGSEPGSLARSMITANGSGGSGGYGGTGTFSRNIKGGGLAGRATTVVEDPVARAGSANVGDATKPGNKAKPTRSPEDVGLVMARIKAALNAIYERALREDPTLEGGKVVVEMKIAPTGEVVPRLVSSDLHAPALESKLLARIRIFDFGAKDVSEMVERRQFDFVPS